MPPARTRLIGARLVDGGSGYDAQNDMPVHVGVPAGVSRVDVQVIVPRGGKRTPIWQRGVTPGQDDYGSNELTGSTRNIVITPSTTRCQAICAVGVTSYASVGPLDPLRPFSMPNAISVLPFGRRRAELTADA